MKCGEKKIDAGIVFIAYQGEPSLIVLKKCVLKIFASILVCFKIPYSKYEYGI